MVNGENDLSDLCRTVTVIIEIRYIDPIFEYWILLKDNKTKVMQLEPAFGEPGAYETTFCFTVPTTVTYGLFGTINNTTVDLKFTCVPTGEAGAAPDNSTAQISEGVVRKGLEGRFGCPSPLTDAGFPEPLTSNFDFTTRLDQLQSEISPMNTSAGSMGTNSTTVPPE